jgi:cytochrome c oxidase cbb3-type subunit 3
MPVGERDPHTGIFTTGHEWSGITELDTPIPRAVKFFYGLTFAVALAMWILLPTWPLLTTYTPGLLGYSQRDFLRDQLAAAVDQRAGWEERIAALDLNDSADDPEARAIAIGTGETLYADNCAVCHGLDAKGGPGFPDLRDRAWLWGGSAEEIHETLRVGINSQHDETRSGQMPGFGRDQILEREDIRALVTYVRQLAGLEQAEAQSLEVGEALFAENCASCHGEDARGEPTLGAPNLTDGFWIYGGDRETLYRTLFGGRQGHMPHWGDRLSPVQLKILALYVRSLSQP